MCSGMRPTSRWINIQNRSCWRKATISIQYEIQQDFLSPTSPKPKQREKLSTRENCAQSTLTPLPSRAPSCRECRFSPPPTGRSRFGSTFQCKIFTFLQPAKLNAIYQTRRNNNDFDIYENALYHGTNTRTYTEKQNVPQPHIFSHSSAASEDIGTDLRHILKHWKSFGERLEKCVGKRPVMAQKLELLGFGA